MNKGIDAYGFATGKWSNNGDKELCVDFYLLTNTTVNSNGETVTFGMTPQKIGQSVIHQKLKEGHNVRLVQAFAGHIYPKHRSLSNE